MKRFIYRVLFFILFFTLICFFGNLTINVILNARDLALIFVGSIILSLPAVIELGLKKQTEKKCCFLPYIYVLAKNAFITGSFVSLVFLLAEISSPNLLSENDSLIDVVFQKIFISLRPCIYGLLILVIIGNKKAEKTQIEQTFNSDLIESKKENLLSRRETEVARLASQGFTNTQIADELFISPVTVKRHLATIFSKTGLTSRRQLANFFKN